MKKKEPKKQTTTPQPAPPAAQTPAEEPQKKKISANEFVLNLLCEKPDQTPDQVTKALEGAGLKMNEWTIKAWIRDMKKIYARFDQLGLLKKAKGK